MNDYPEKTGKWYIISSCLLLICFLEFSLGKGSQKNGNL